MTADLPRAVLAGAVVLGSAWAIAQFDSAYAWLFAVIILLGIVTFNAGTFNAEISRLIGG